LLSEKGVKAWLLYVIRGVKLNLTAAERFYKELSVALREKEARLGRSECLLVLCLEPVKMTVHGVGYQNPETIFLVGEQEGGRVTVATCVGILVLELRVVPVSFVATVSPVVLWGDLEGQGEQDLAA